LGNQISFLYFYIKVCIIYFVEHFFPSCTFAEKLFLVLHGREFKGNKLKTQNEHVSEKKKIFLTPPIKLKNGQS
jgi:hypothetical protein